MEKKKIYYLLWLAYHRISLMRYDQKKGYFFRNRDMYST